MTDLAAEEEPLAAAPEPEPLPLLELAGPVPEPITDSASLADAVAALAAGTGPVAIDAERASGYRYGQRCYLVQIRREGAGSFLIDPLGCPNLSSLDAAVADAEWILHAASQDLPCLAELGLRPRTLFDTELAARLAGYERVGLATMVEIVLERRLDKGASSADWSQRPLPPGLLRYAALDVEVLIKLRDHLAVVLEEQGKTQWAREEFAAIVAAPQAVPRMDPWRRTSGIHRLRTPRQLAGVRSFWERRDTLARERDVAPGRVLPDAAIIDAVLRWPMTPDALAALPVFGGRSNKRRLSLWFGALEEAAALPDRDLPPITGPADGAPPPAHRWAERDPVAAARLAAARAAVNAIAARHNVPVENLVEPATVRRLAWTPPEPATDAAVADSLRDLGAREWQVDLVAEALGAALRGGVTVSLVPCSVALARAVVSGDLSSVTAGRGWPHADTLDALRPYAEHGSDLVPGPFLVVSDGAVIGDCGWYGPPDSSGEVEIGYGLAAPFRNRGLGRAAVSQLVAWVSSQPGVVRVVAETDAANTASRRVLERLGFGLETAGGTTVRYALAVAERRSVTGE